jgi:hypothetical protein
MNRFTLGIIIVLVSYDRLLAQSAVYSPYANWHPAISHWESHRVSLDAASKKQAGRPSLPGLRPVSVELLQDALIRKHPKLLRNDQSMARRLISRRYFAGVNGRNQLHGAMAEALFLKNNPDWAYVSKPNAPQHDVYRRMTGNRPPLNGQIKFHMSGNPGTYARDMLNDYRAHRFLIPNDHVQPVREYWLRKYELANQRGDAVGAKQAARNAGRVQPMGVTKQEIVTNTKLASEHTAAEIRSVYVSLAAGIALSLGQVGWDYAHGTISKDQAAYRATKSLILIGTGVATNSSLVWIRNGAMRGTLKGNLIVGAVVFLVDTSWSVVEHGGMAAFQHPGFYEEIGGSVSGLAIGGVAGFYSGVAATAAASELGPAAPVVGGVTGLVVGTGVGIVAYIGGRSAASWLVRSFWPELYQQFQKQQITATKDGISRRLEAAQAYQ